MFVRLNVFLVAVLAALLVATAALYWPGLSGPYLFDDYGNMEAVDRWHAGEQGLALTLLPNESSIVFSRPVSMSSFVASAKLTGATPFSYKLGNLIVHLACGLLVLTLLEKLLKLDGRFGSHAGALAVFISAVWLLHPLHASTVLYIVQRSAQISALFTISALLVYLAGRQSLSTGNKRKALVLLFGAFPMLLVAGVLSKQNAAVAAYLCLVIEICYFHTTQAERRTLLPFFGTFAMLPALAVAALLATKPATLLGGYAEWDFTLAQRLLSQPRALVEYLIRTVVPNGPAMGVYTDDFVVSTGLLAPPSTVISIILLLAATSVAVLLRRRAPSVLAGWGFFLVAHSVESSFLPLEMYYEHRNYLPSVGLLLAFAGLAGLLVRRLTLRPQRLLFPLAAATLLVLAFATYGRARIWKTEDAIVSQALAQHPGSMRAMIDQGTIHIKRREYAQALSVTEPMRQSTDQRQRLVGHLQRVAVECMADGIVDPMSMAEAVRQSMPRLTVYEAHMSRLLLLGTADGTCGQYSTRYLAAGLEAITSAGAPRGRASSIADSMSLASGQLYARAGAWADAERMAQAAWANHTYTPAGALLIRFYVRRGDVRAAEKVLRDLRGRIRKIDTVGQQQLGALESLVEEAGRLK